MNTRQFYCEYCDAYALGETLQDAVVHHKELHERQKKRIKSELEKFGYNPLGNCERHNKLVKEYALLAKCNRLIEIWEQKQVIP